MSHALTIIFKTGPSSVIFFRYLAPRSTVGVFRPSMPKNVCIDNLLEGRARNDASCPLRHGPNRRRQKRSQHLMVLREPLPFQFSCDLFRSLCQLIKRCSTMASQAWSSQLVWQKPTRPPCKHLASYEALQIKTHQYEPYLSTQTSNYLGSSPIRAVDRVT
jgi:hypothetical protein